MTTDEAIERVVEAVDDLIWASKVDAASKAPNRDTLRSALKELLAAHDAALGMRDCFDPNCGKPGRHIGDCDKE